MAYEIKPLPADSIRFTDLGIWLRDHAINKRLVPSYGTLLALRNSGFIPAEYGANKKCRYVKKADLPLIARTLGLAINDENEGEADEIDPTRYAVRNLAA